MVLGATVLALGAKSRRGADGAGRSNSVGKERRTVKGATMMPLLAGSSGGRMDSGGLGVALPCASAKRSRLFHEVFDDCSSAGCKLSPRDGAIIRELNETVLVGFFYWRQAVLVVLNHVENGVLHLVHRTGITCTSPSPPCYL